MAWIIYQPDIDATSITLILNGRKMKEEKREWTRSSSCIVSSSKRAFRSVSFDEHQMSSSRRVSRGRYDVTSTMDRLRADMVGAEISSHNDANNSEEVEEILLPRTTGPPSRSSGDYSVRKCLFKTAGQIPAILLIGMFHMMIGIPFGVSYFPIGWKNGGQVSSEEANNGDVCGPFPLPGKEALGIRMFLFSTIVGQIVFTLMSGFDNPIGLQASFVIHECILCPVDDLNEWRVALADSSFRRRVVQHILSSLFLVLRAR